MSKMIKKSLLLFFILILSGCGNGGMMNVIKLPVSDETITEVTGSITDTSVQKEALYTNMVKNRDRAYAKMYAQSGFHVKFKLVEVAPGVKIQMMDEVSFKEAPRFQQDLTAGPSEHPVWRFGEKVLVKGFDTFLWWTGIDAAKTVFSESIKSAQPRYYGDYNPQTAAPFVVEQPPPIIIGQ
jgi:hypothetical protein